MGAGIRAQQQMPTYLTVDPTIEVQGFRLANAGWVKNGPMLQVRRLEARLSLPALKLVQNLERQIIGGVDLRRKGLTPHRTFSGLLAGTRIVYSVRGQPMRGGAYELGPRRRELEAVQG